MTIKETKVYTRPKDCLWTMFIIIVHTSTGVMQLNRTDALVDAHEYPATTEELIEAYGDYRLELQNGSETVGEVLARLENETFESAEEVSVAIYSAVSNKAIGRVGYSDRDPTPPGSPYAPDVVSF